MASAALVAGTARVDITPDDLVGLNPMGHTFSAVHDPIHARVLTLSDGTTTVALISVDLIEVGDTASVRRRIQDETGIAATHVVIAPSHSHNAPRIGHIPAGGKARIPSPESLVYSETVYDALVGAVRAALSTAEPATIGVGRTEVDVNMNRDVHVGDRWELGLDPEGPSDKTLSVIVVKSAATGAVRAVLLNYAVHSTVTLGTGELGADLAGAAAALVEQELDGAVALWTCGALGDQAPHVSLGEPTGDSHRDRRYAYGFAQAQGMLVGAAALSAAAAIPQFDSEPRITAVERVVGLPARKLEVGPGMIQEDVDSVELSMSCVTVGGIALVGVSGEVTVPVFRALQAISPVQNTILISMANARVGYLPADEAYDRSTHASRGCPIVKGHVQKAIVDNLGAMITSALVRSR